jgi:hypothetical protein
MTLLSAVFAVSLAATPFAREPGHAGDAHAGHDHSSHAGHTHGRHDMPVHPVHARLLADPGLVRVRIVTDGAVLANELLGLDLPASGWPEEKLRQARLWLENNFSLAADGTPLTATLHSASYRIDAWKKVSDVGTAGWDGMFVFELRYPLPDGAAKLSGEARFYEQDWRHLEDMLETGQKPLFRKNFMTYLEVPGRRAARLEIGVEKPGFELPLADALRTGPQRFLEAASWGWRLPWPALYLLMALVLILGKAPPAAVAAGAAAALAGVLLPGAFAMRAAGQWLALSAAAFTALAKPRKPGGWLLGVSGFGGILLGLGWNHAIGTLSTLPINRAAAAAGFLTGSAATGLLAAAAAIAAVAGYRAYLKRESEQMASRLFEKNSKFAIFAAGAAGLLYAARVLLQT